MKKSFLKNSNLQLKNNNLQLEKFTVTKLENLQSIKGGSSVQTDHSILDTQQQ